MTNSNKTVELRTEISKILVKWGMPTRQIAIIELLKLFQSELELRDKQLQINIGQL